MKREDIIKLIGMTPKILIVIRGVSGSGKSTLAEYIAKECHPYNSNFICEADDYHYDTKGNYNFQHSNLTKAHHWCYGMVLQNILKGYSCIVSNTSTRVIEFEKYIRLAKDFDYRVIVLRCTGDYKDIHNVPEEVLKLQKSRFEDYEGEIYVD